LLAVRPTQAFSRREAWGQLAFAALIEVPPKADIPRRRSKSTWRKFGTPAATIPRPKVAAEMPKSTVIGCMKRPRLCRKPMQIEMMVPLRMSSMSMERREEASVIS
jgi:hypothetical protein